MKKLALCLALLASACVTRTVVQAPSSPPPSPQSLYHVAEDNLIRSAVDPRDVKCERVYATPSYDSARCAFSSGAVIYAWNSAEQGFDFTVLVPAPKPPQADKPPEQKPEAPSAAKSEPPSKKK